MRKTALITGASGGIGLELARLFARDGFDLVLVARSISKLEALQKELVSKHPVSVHVIFKDLSSPLAAQELFEQLQKDGIAVDVLVNNAGVGSFGMFKDIELARHEQIMDLNMVSLTQLTYLCLKPMLKKNSGRIMNVASIAAFQPGPLMAVYYATKAYVLHLSEALADELRDSGVTVTTLCPGPTRTGFQQTADMGSSKLFKRAVMDAAVVAQDGYRGMMAGKRIVIPGLQNKVLARSPRFAPRSLVTRVVRKIQESE